MYTDNVGSLRCVCCNRELKEYEFVYCDNCEELSRIEGNLKKIESKKFKSCKEKINNIAIIKTPIERRIKGEITYV